MSFITHILRMPVARSAAFKTLARSANGSKFSALQTLGPLRPVQTSASLRREEVTVTFVRTSGEKMVAKGKVGDNLV